MNPLVKGKVAGGNRLGRTLGFPTANIPLKEDDPVCNGVYAARVRIDGTEHEAVVNVGHRPTVGNGPDRVLEAHLLDFEGDLYGQTIEVELLAVHKAQGSEYRGVVFIGAPCAPSLMVRGVLYTAITRARELLVIVGDDSAVNKMAENDRRSRRYSGLKWRLRKGGEEK